MPKFSLPVCSLHLSLVLLVVVSTAVAQSDVQNVETPYLQFSVNNLVLSQTGSKDKNNLKRLCDGDRVVEWNETKVETNRQLVDAWLGCAGMTKVKVKVERQMNASGQLETKLITVDYVLLYASKLFARCSSGGRENYSAAESLYPDIPETHAQKLHAAFTETIKNGSEEILQPLERAFARLTDLVRGHYRTDDIAFLLNKPLSVADWGRYVSDQLAAADNHETRVRFGIRRVWTGKGDIPQAELSDIPEMSDWKQLCEWLTNEVEIIQRNYQQATSSLTEDERVRWNEWCRKFQVRWQGEPMWQSYCDDFQLTKKLDYNELLKAWQRTARLAEALRPGGKLYQKIESLASNPPREKFIGKVAIGGSEDSLHEDFLPVTIDLGGNDQYRFPEFGLPVEFPVRLIVDMSGNDSYSGKRNAAASATGGVSVLIDAAGNDSYQVDECGIGFAVCGLALLDDAAGEDIYVGQQLTQGTACVGVAILLDRKGNDQFNAGKYSQATGLPGGFGTIVDQSGDDHYQCSGKFPSAYGDVGEYNAMGQGCGLGFRGLGFGGVGILQDLSGRDFYRTGQFGLGCGYFFGTGLVNDRAGDDVFECSRYGLGTAAHYAAGIVLDDGGDDVYLATRRSAVAEMGSSWDLSLGALIDSSGNDVYRCRNYALGGAAQTSYGIFWDQGGDDHYLSSPNATGSGGYIGGANYGAGRGAENLAIFFDEAGNDFYASPKKNQSKGVQGKYGVWIDR